tara:strand:- start:230 stop:814 length:585 start_codon:yes stop_codon:yes gene_type:complete
MTNVCDYKFYGLSDLKNDKCEKTESEIQNNQFGDYSVKNFFDCNMDKAIKFATCQPNVFYKGGLGFSDYCGSNIDTDSKLRIGGVQTSSPCKISLYERPFATVPYLGKGPVRPVIESQVQQGTITQLRKDCGSIMEKTYIKHKFTPLVPSLKATITNPHNLVEESADEGWVRGGISTRDYAREQDYLEKHANNI